MNKQTIKKTAQSALKLNYGFAPALADITLLEASGDRTYILFTVGQYEYEFNSFTLSDGSVWIDAGQVEQTAIYKWTHGEYKRIPL